MSNQTLTELKIEIKRLREAMPNGSTITTGRKKGSVYFECKTLKRVSDEDFEMIKEWFREIIGHENISEFYTLTEGAHWFVYLKNLNIPISVEIN